MLHPHKDEGRQRDRHHHHNQNGQQIPAGALGHPLGGAQTVGRPCTEKE